MNGLQSYLIGVQLMKKMMEWLLKWRVSGCCNWLIARETRALFQMRNTWNGMYCESEYQNSTRKVQHQLLHHII